MNYWLEKFYGRRAPEDGTGGGAGAGDQAAADAAAAAAAADATKTAADAGSKEPVKTALGAAGGDAIAKKEGEAKTEEPAAYVDDPAKTAEENATAKAAHDKGIADAKTAKDAADAKAAEDAKKAEDAAKVIDPASYKIEVPEGFNLNPEVETSFRTFAAEHKLDQAGVDKLKDMQLQLYSKAAEAHATQVAEWGESLKTHPELGGAKYEEKIGIAATAMAEFFPPAVVTLLDKTGLGNHPDFVTGWYRVGKAMGETPTLRSQGGGAGKESVLDILYPSAKKDT